MIVTNYRTRSLGNLDRDLPVSHVLLFYFACTTVWMNEETMGTMPESSCLRMEELKTQRVLVKKRKAI